MAGGHCEYSSFLEYLVMSIYLALSTVSTSHQVLPTKSTFWHNLEIATSTVICDEADGWSEAVDRELKFHLKLPLFDIEISLKFLF